MKQYYAGIGSRKTPVEIMSIMTEIARKLEEMNYILRSGAAHGADTAFEQGVSNSEMKDIYLPFPNFKGRNDKSCIYIELGDPDFDAAYESLKIHPTKGKMGSSAKNMMLRNYFQIHGIRNQPLSSFVICWTPDAANGTTIKTSYDTGGTGQAIRLAAINNIPVYNLADPKFKGLSADKIIDIILNKPNSTSNVNVESTKLF